MHGNPSEQVLKSFEERLAFVIRFCRRRAGTGNRDSPREFSGCIEHGDGEKLIAELVRRAHKGKRLEAGVRLMFDVRSINETAIQHGVTPLVIEKREDEPAQRVA